METISSVEKGVIDAHDQYLKADRGLSASVPSVVLHYHDDKRIMIAEYVTEVPNDISTIVLRGLALPGCRVRPSIFCGKKETIKRRITTAHDYAEGLVRFVRDVLRKYNFSLELVDSRVKFSGESFALVVLVPSVIPPLRVLMDDGAELQQHLLQEAVEVAAAFMMEFKINRITEDSIKDSDRFHDFFRDGSTSSLAQPPKNSLKAKWFTGILNLLPMAPTRDKSTTADDDGASDPRSRSDEYHVKVSPSSEEKINHS